MTGRAATPAPTPADAAPAPVEPGPPAEPAPAPPEPAPARAEPVPVPPEPAPAPAEPVPVPPEPDAPPEPAPAPAEPAPAPPDPVPVPPEPDARPEAASAPGADPDRDADLPGDAARTPRREATRQRVLDAAREVFAERGVIGGTVEDICERAGYTRGAFYSNFADKDEVIDALVEREQNRLLEQLDAMFADVDREVAAATDLPSVLRAIIDRILLALPIDRELSLIQAELETFAIRRPDLAGRFVAINLRFHQRITAFIADAMRRNGRELLVEPWLLTEAIVGITQRSVRRALLDGDADPNALAGAILPGLLLAFSRRTGDTSAP